MSDEDRNLPPTANKFLDSYLYMRGGTVAAAAWVEPSAMYMPVTTPHNPRKSTDMGREKRNAQLLGGLDVPRVILKSLTTKKTNAPLFTPDDTILISHWTPLDACLEMICLERQASTVQQVQFAIFAATERVEQAVACAKRLAHVALDDWKTSTGRYIARGNLTYSEELPDVVSKNIAAPIAPDLKLAKYVTDAKEAVTLPSEIRSKWLEHIVHGPEWKTALQLFDDHIKTVTVVTGPAAEDGEALPTMSTSDFVPIDDVREQHNIETELTTDIQNVTLLITKGTAEQKPMCFAAATGGAARVEPVHDVLKYGPGDWAKPPHAEKLLTKVGGKSPEHTETIVAGGSQNTAQQNQNIRKHVSSQVWHVHGGMVRG